MSCLCPNCFQEYSAYLQACPHCSRALDSTERKADTGSQKLGSPSDEVDVLESRDFYEVCQQYRHSREVPIASGMLNTIESFEALKNWIRTHCTVGMRPVGDGGWLTGDSRSFESSEIKFCPACEKDWQE